MTKEKKQIRKQISIVPPNAANKLIPKVFSEYTASHCFHFFYGSPLEIREKETFQRQHPSKQKQQIHDTCAVQLCILGSLKSFQCSGQFFLLQSNGF